MTGFGVDIGGMSALPGKFSDIGETLTGAAGSIGDTGGGDFGHPQLNQIVSQVSGLFGDYLSGLGKSAGGMGDHLQSTLQSYAASDGSNAQNLGSIGADAGSAVGSVDGGASGILGGDSSNPFGLGDNPIMM